LSTIPAVTAPVTFAARTVQNVGHDFRYAVRTLLKSPGFAAVAVLTMALGIGAATVTFSIVYNVLVNPLPYKDVRRSVVFSIRGLTGVGGWKGRSNFFGPEFLAIREQNHVFEDLIGWQTVTVLHDDGQSTRVFRGAYITANTFDFLGVPPLVGRPVTREDGRDGAAAVFAMNYLLWQGEFGADPGLIGKTFVLNGQPRTLVGIMPPRFNAFAADLWLATGVSAAGVGLTPMGRLKPGIGVDAASADLDAIMHRFDKEHPGGNNPSEFAVVAQTFLDSLLGSFKRTLIALVAAVTLLLLIACTNVANLMLARATTREREIALRASIGATSGRLVRLLLVESLVLSAGAALAGSFLAYAGLKIVVAMLFQILRMVLVSGLGPVGAGGVIGLGTGYAVSGVLADRLAGVPVTDPITLGSVVVLVIAVGLTACVLPARQATRVDPLVALRSE
jgi:putative ABC transport system permease protein